MEVRLMASQQQNGHVPEFAVAALEAAISGLECGASDEEAEQAFVTVYNALAQLGWRDCAIDPNAALSADQQEMWDLCRPHEYAPSGGQTPAQARHFAGVSFTHVRWFDGVVPSPDDVIYAEIDLRRRESTVGGRA